MSQSAASPSPASESAGADPQDPAADIALVVNGEPRRAASGARLPELLEALGLGGMRVAVERNRAIVPRAEHAGCVLEDGDELEIVHFVGGG